MIVGSPTKLNLIPSGVMPIVYINQSDAGYDKEFLIYNGNSPYNVPAGVSATIRGKKADGYGVTETAALTTGSNLVTVTVTEQMVAAEGANLYELVFVDTDGLRIATINMVWAVKPDALGDAVISDSDLNYVNEALDKIQNAESMKNQLNINTAAISAETSARIAADNALQTSINGEATTRSAQDYLLQTQINQIIAPTGEAPSAAEVENARISADGVTYSTLGEAIRTQVDDLDNKIDDISTIIRTENIYDESAAIVGKYVDQTDGKTYNSASYSLFEYMDCSAYETLIISRSIETLTGINIRYAFYDENKVYMSGGTGGGLNVSYDSDVLRYYATIPTNGAKYISLSYNKNEVLTNRRMCIGGSLIYVPYVRKRIPKNTEENEHIVSSVIKGAPATAEAASMAANDSLSVFANNVSTANEIIFYAQIGTFSRIDVGHINASDKGMRFAIGGSKITYFLDGNSTGQINHGLTIKDYIYFKISVSNSTNDYTLTLATNGGVYQRTDQFWSGWYGSPIVTVGANTTLTHCKLTYNIDTLSSNYWLFGDSYLGKGSTRWPYYMFADNINDVLLNSWPGATAQDIYPAFANLIQKSKPKYACWFLGMNNADSADLNAYWQINTENFIIECITNGITPILATIPNTPVQNNLKKNAYVRKCGLRYVDFAAAVNAESASAPWFSGMLDTDQVHPTAEGARALYLEFLSDFPEILNSKEINA